MTLPWAGSLDLLFSPYPFVYLSALTLAFLTIHSYISLIWHLHPVLYVFILYCFVYTHSELIFLFFTSSSALYCLFIAHVQHTLHLSISASLPWLSVWKFRFIPPIKFKEPDPALSYSVLCLPLSIRVYIEKRVCFCAVSFVFIYFI